VDVTEAGVISTALLWHPVRINPEPSKADVSSAVIVIDFIRKTSWNYYVTRQRYSYGMQ
jgi:hypothetical protein